jgi:hypothetical protein
MGNRVKVYRLILLNILNKEKDRIDNELHFITFASLHTKMYNIE